MANPTAQDAAFQNYTEENFELLTNYQSYIGKTIDGILITESGLLAGAHLVGEKAVKTFLSTDGANIPHDGSKPPVPVTKYLKEFSNYTFTFPPSSSGFSSAFNTHAQTPPGGTYPQTALPDRAAPSAAKTVEPVPAKSEAGHDKAAWDLQDAAIPHFAYLGAEPTGEDARGWSAHPVSGAVGLHDHMTAVAEAMLSAEREKARTSPTRGASADTPANHGPDWRAPVLSGAVQVNKETVALAAALYKAIQKEVSTPAAHSALTHRRRGPSGHRDDPISIHPNSNAESTRMRNGQT